MYSIVVKDVPRPSRSAVVAPRLSQAVALSQRRNEGGKGTRLS